MARTKRKNNDTPRNTRVHEVRAFKYEQGFECEYCGEVEKTLDSLRDHINYICTMKPRPVAELGNHNQMQNNDVVQDYDQMEDDNIVIEQENNVQDNN